MQHLLAKLMRKITFTVKQGKVILTSTVLFLTCIYTEKHNAHVQSDEKV